MNFFPHTVILEFFRTKLRHSKKHVIKTLHFFAQFILLPASDDANYEKQNLTEAEQIIKLDFYLRVQNTKIFILSAMSLQVWQRLTGVYYSADNIC